MEDKKINSVENLEKVIDNDKISVCSEMDINLANAYVEAKEADAKLEEVVTELEDNAKEVTPEDPATPEVKEKNIYTKLTLDESMEDFKMPNKLSDESDEDDYLDYTMFDFIYGLVTDDWPKPKNPLGRRMRKFQHTESDDYVKTNEPTGMSQVSTDYKGNIVVYADDVEAFNDVREACDYYHISYSDVEPRMSKSSHWKFHMTIYVPMSSDDYPMMAEDFFAEYGLTLSDVIEDNKVGGGKSANWGTTYSKKAEKDRAEKIKYVNDLEVQKIYEKHRNRAGNSSEPLDIFITDMFDELKQKGLKFSKAVLKKKFLSEFEDDFEED